MIFRRKSDSETTGVVAQPGPAPGPEMDARVDDADYERPDPVRLRAEADAALDHALREEPVVESVDDYDDDGTESPVALPASLAGDLPAEGGDDVDAETGAPESGDEGEAYVLYADVQPHLDELARLQVDRQRFIELCLYARDRVSSPAAAERIDAGLLELGIEALRPDGERFDPALHEAAATVATDDPALHGMIAETETPGYSDGGYVVRPPIVTVYRAGPA